MFGRKYKKVIQNFRQIQSSSSKMSSAEDISKLIDTSNHFYNSKRKKKNELKT